MTTYLYTITFIGGFVVGMLYAAWATHRAEQKQKQEEEMNKLLSAIATLIAQKEAKENHEAQK